jgi:hypothetical protein
MAALSTNLEFPAISQLNPCPSACGPVFMRVLRSKTISLIFTLINSLFGRC